MINIHLNINLGILKLCLKLFPSSLLFSVKNKIMKTAINKLLFNMILYYLN